VVVAGDVGDVTGIGVLGDTCEAGVGVPVDGGDSKSRIRSSSAGHIVAPAFTFSHS